MDIRDLDRYQSVPEAFFALSTKFPDLLVYEQAAEDPGNTATIWQSCNYRQVAEHVRKVAVFLQAQGVKAGDRVAIISQSRPEWLEANLAILSLGAISVSVYQTLPANEIAYILFDSDSKVIFAENNEQLQKLIWLQENRVSIAATEERSASEEQLKFSTIVTFEEVGHSVANVSSWHSIMAGQQKIEELTNIQITRSDLATLVYTSGTTGPPKGVMQTHGNHLSNCRQAWVSGMLSAGASIMVFLPLAHSFAKLMGYLAMVSHCTLKFPRIADRNNSKMNPELTMEDVRSGSANIVPIVPRILEKMQSGIIAKSRTGGLAGQILKLALWAAEKTYNAKLAGQTTSLLTDIVFNGTASIRDKIKLQLFGPNFHYAISGGAKLNPDTCKFFDQLGIDVLEGYGLTETCVATNVNPPGRKKIGTVGPVLDRDIELRIAADGEIVFRGPNIAKGYFKREKATASVWDKDGWFYTGDLGAVDSDGYLSIVGRKKDLLVSSYGKKIAPESIEAAIKSSHFISQAVLIGDGRPYCIAVITLELAAVKKYFAGNNLSQPTNFDSDQTVKNLIQSELERVNRTLANFEQVRGFIIATEDFTVENGFLTPTFKVKKQLVIQKYAQQIADCYKE